MLTDGLRLVHHQGFGASSVRDITQAAGVPLGSRVMVVVCASAVPAMRVTLPTLPMAS